MAEVEGEGGQLDAVGAERLHVGVVDKAHAPQVDHAE